MQHFANSLRALVARDQPKLALAVLNDFLAKEMPSIADSGLLLQAQLNRLSQETATGLVNSADARQRLAQINAGILQLINEVAQHPADEMKALARAREVEVAFSKKEINTLPAQRSTAWLRWAGIAAVAVLAIGGIWWTQKSPAPSRVTQEKSAMEALKPQKPSEQIGEWDAWVKKAENFQEQGQWQSAYTAVNNAFGLGFDNADLYNQRADILLHLNRFAEARDDAQKAITLNPNYCYSYLTLAQAYAKLGDVEAFYHNVEMSLRKNCEVGKLTDHIGIADFKKEARLQRLLKKYEK